MEASMDFVPICGFPVMEAASKDIAENLLSTIEERNRRIIFFANTNFVMKCGHLQERMPPEEVVILNDGLGMDLAAYLVRRRAFKENLNGTDFIPYLLKQAKRKLRVYLLGSSPDSLFSVAKHVNRAYGQRVVGLRDGYESLSSSRAVLKSINRAQPDMLLVALGNPYQEEWILKHRHFIQCPLIFAVGGLFDFWAGVKPRAPFLVQKMRLEWLFRLCLEPQRMLRRYTVDVARFFLKCRNDIATRKRSTTAMTQQLLGDRDQRNAQ